MATKQQVINSPTSCLNKAGADEPIFVLRAHDPIASDVVRIWASLARNRHERSKSEEAWRIAVEMENWQSENLSKMEP